MLHCRNLTHCWLVGLMSLGWLVGGASLGGANPIVEPTGAPRPGTTSPHPAVVRILVAEGKSQSLGSGTLVDVRDQFGLVVTNWHVIRDAQGEIVVLFPDGFRSAARVVQHDVDWDLAALSIWRPQAQPVVVALEPPRPGEALAIAGYGSDGSYRVASGACTQYLAPSGKHPYELVELAATARQGDSGGPIFNQRGELAGVLFGTVEGTTAGSYGGRVWKFLEPLLNRTQPLAAPQLAVAKLSVPALASAEPGGASARPLEATSPPAEILSTAAPQVVPREPITATEVVDAASPRLRTAEPFPFTNAPFATTPVSSLSPSLPGVKGPTNADPTHAWLQLLLGQTPVEQAKAFFSLVGIATIAGWLFRWNAAPPAAGRR
jgi:S1-C subfamily serine protease